MSPKYGDMRVASCTWCGELNITQTFCPYETPLKGGFWDTGNCPCSEIVGSKGDLDMLILRGLGRYGQKIVNAHRENANQPKQYKNGKPTKRSLRL